MFIKNVRGFSLIEILVLGTIVSIISLGTLKLLNISIQSAQVSNATFSEEELIKSIKKGITKESACHFNLYYKKLNGTQDQGKGTISELKTPDDVILLQEDTTFKNNLHIVKMELDGTQTLNVNSGTPVERFFTVYYKKINMGKLNTLGGGTCTPSTVSGCYFQSYKMMYALKDNAPPEYDLEICGFSDPSQVNCYSVDDYDETLPEDDLSAKDKGRSLIGCRGASGIQHSRTVSLGFATGEKNTSGFSNIFIGYRAGKGNETGNKNTIIGAALGPPGTITGSSNVFIGYEAGLKNTIGEKNTFIGMNTGLENTKGKYNTFIGVQAGMDGTTIEESIFIGMFAGEKTGVISGTSPIVKGNVFLGYGSGHGESTHNNIGEFNTFMGYHSGYRNTEGNHNIYVGYKVGPRDPPQADIRQDSHQQLNLGNLILGRIPDPNSTPLQDSPDIPTGNGVVINGNLIVKGTIKYDCGNSCKTVSTAPTFNSSTYAFNPISSKAYKKNIKPFKNFEKALDDIINTPLFTYEYKKDHPKKSRMGIISEELPEHLQIKDLDSGLRRNDKLSRNDKLRRNDGAKGKSSAKKKPSMPDWPSVYGTFWASIKTLFLQFKSFKETVLAELKKIKEQFTSTLTVIERNKKTLTSFNKQIQKTTKDSQINQEKNNKQKKELAKIKSFLEKAKVELEANRRELHQIRNIVQKGVK